MLQTPFDTNVDKANFDDKIHNEMEDISQNNSSI